MKAGPSTHPRPTHLGLLAAIVLTGAAARPLMAQQTQPAKQHAQQTFELDAQSGQWIAKDAPEPGSDAWVIAQSRQWLAEDKPGKADALLTSWLKEHERTDNPWLAEAYMLRGDARAARKHEFQALFDYEKVAKDFPSSEVFLPTLEREYRVGKMYLEGLKKRFLWFRWTDASSVGVELMMRIQERAPGSQLAEDAAITLADYFYRTRELSLAAEMYGIFLINYPKSPHRMHALLRQIYANVAQFKGPAYDASPLIEAKALIEQFQQEYPQQAEELGITDALLARLDESAAAQMLNTAQWYLKRKDPFSARFTLERLMIRHAGTVAAAKGAELLKAHGWAMPQQSAAPLPEELDTLLKEQTRQQTQQAESEGIDEGSP